MIKNPLFIFMTVVILFLLVAEICIDKKGFYADPFIRYPSGMYRQNRIGGHRQGGFGMTYSGKLGVGLGGGLIMPFDGSGIGLGF